MFLFKFSGIILIVVACGVAGFLKSFSIKSRYQKLSAFCDGLDLLYEYVELGECELDKAVKNAFYKCDFIHSNNQKTLCKDCDLTCDDVQAINSFFASLGFSSKKAECDRINSCRIMMKKRFKDAEHDVTQKCKLYQTFGVCIGLTIGILLI